MSATAFQRARREAANKANSGEECKMPRPEIEEQLLEGEAKTGDDDESNAEPVSPREQRQIQLEKLGWTILKQMLEDNELSTDKPDDKSWKEYAIPLLLDKEGF